jgi:hypothetical protein
MGFLIKSGIMNMSKGLIRLPAVGIGPLLFERELESSSNSHAFGINKSISWRPARDAIRNSTFWNPEGSNPYTDLSYPPHMPEKASVSYGDGAVGYEWIKSSYGGYSEEFFVQSLSRFKWGQWAINNNTGFYGNRSGFQYPSNDVNFYESLRIFIEDFEGTNHTPLQSGQRIKVWISIDMYVLLGSRYYPFYNENNDTLPTRPIIDRYYDQPMGVVSKYRVYAS